MSEVQQPASQKQRLKDVAQLGKQLDKKMGTKTLMRLGDRVGVPVAVIPTGLAAVDYEALLIGGLYKGRVIEIFGPESAGKTSLALNIIGETQKAGGVAAMIDAEHALDPTWAGKLGVDVDNLFVMQPDNAEQALQTLDELITSNLLDLIVLDSVAALAPQAELNGEIGDAHVGLLPRLMAQTLRMITGKMNKSETKTTVVFLNQIREKIGVMYGNPETQPGGRALKFYASQRIDVRRKEWIGKKDENPIGTKIKVKIIKNKGAAPFRESFVDLYFGIEGHEPGFDKPGSAIDLAFERGVVYKEGTGTTYFFNKEKIGIGEAASKLEIRTNPKLLQSVQDAIAKAINTPKVEG